MRKYQQKHGLKLKNIVENHNNGILNWSTERRVIDKQLLIVLTDLKLLLY